MEFCLCYVVVLFWCGGLRGVVLDQYKKLFFSLFKFSFLLAHKNGRKEFDKEDLENLIGFILTWPQR